AGVAPVDPWREQVGTDSRAIALDQLDHVVDQGVGQLVGLETQVEQLLVLGVVVVSLLLRARIGNVLDLGRQTVRKAGIPDLLGQLSHAELFRELIEDAVLTGLRWIEGRRLDTADGVTNVEKAARLPTFAVDGEGMTDGGLAT